jgi:hypothetical protein
MNDMDYHDNGEDQIGRIVIFVTLAAWMTFCGGWFGALAAFFIIMAIPSVFILIDKLKKQR